MYFPLCYNYDGIFVIWNYTVHVHVIQRKDLINHLNLHHQTRVGSDLDEGQLHSLTFNIHEGSIISGSVEDLVDNGVSVGVRLICEPNNPIDAKAISFQCYYGGSWVIIIYILHEILDDVHFPLT